MNIMAEKDKKKIEQPTTEQPTVQVPAPAEPTLSGERQQFGQPVQQGFGGGTLGVNTDLNNPTTPTAAPTEQATPATPAKSATQELIESIKAGSEEERQKIERRRRAEETISGIADMGKALSNLYFTGKGAPNMYDPRTAMTPKARERYERALKNWEKNRAASMQYALNKQSADLKQQANDLAQRRIDEQERHNKAVEGRQQLEYELRAAKQRWNEDFQDRKLSQQDKIAKMNADIRRMSVITGMKKSQIAHQLAGYEIHKEKWTDPTTGNVHERTTRTVVNPQTGELEAKTTEEVRQGSSTTNGTTTTTTPQSGNNDSSTPPSRRNTNTSANNNSKTPPSRRK